MVVVGVQEENRRADMTNVEVRLELKVDPIEGLHEYQLEVRRPPEWLCEFVLSNLLNVSWKVMSGRERPRRRVEFYQEKRTNSIKLKDDIDQGWVEKQTGG